MNNVKKIKIYQLKDFETIPQLKVLSKEELFNIRVVANILPFRVNNYVLEELIDWSNVPDDPIFQLTFMQKDMLSINQFNKMADAINRNLDKVDIKKIADSIREELNPHPAGQLTANIPFIDDEPVRGIQHKYRETALIFPTGGQTCHAYCTFCFRWAQFVGIDNLKFATDESKKFQEYLKVHKEITDVLFTGGDPMVMSYKNLEHILNPFSNPNLNTLKI
jgi:L-lysine 2,3-aminomutase